ncbi:MAG TPA: TonB-dependent receptor plug domain-containing protein [Chthoniobacterales bacterium]|nr:TonB-dependent receptor plug domain-containing protein [Chthoniobacterales bacterium]
MHHKILSRSKGSLLASSLVLLACLALSPSLFAQDVTSERIVVTATATPHPHDDTRPKLEHIMREVDGTQITVTKKATVIKLDKQPPIQNNNLQEQFVKAPGLIVSEQQNPGQYNFTYRGLGNPQESEYTLFLQDGLPLMSDWIGFPTLYYVPVPQSVSEIQIIRGGSSLLYGPEPAPAINYVTKRPAPGTPWHAYLEQTGGPDDTYSSYASVEEANGPVEFRADAFYRTSDTQRDSNHYDLWQANGYLGWRPDSHQLLALDVHASEFDGEDPGRLTYAQWLANPDQAVTPYNHNWVDRYTAVLRYELELGDWLIQAKGWYTHQDIDARSAANINPVTGAFPTNTTFGYEEFNNGGFDLRARLRWGEGTMLRGSALTFGGLVYHGDAPFQRYTLNNTAGSLGNVGPGFLTAPRGTTSGLVALDQERSADYQAFFIENVFRFGAFHIVPSFRLDHESVDVDARVAPYFTPGTPSGRSADKLIPLWGIGLGNDFGKGNETYFSASSGWRPVRFFDVAGTRTAITPGTTPDPFRSLDIELGVHGTPIKGFWYDVGLFWMQFDNRIETRPDPLGGPFDTLAFNSGNTRHRGFEGEIAYDLLAPFQHEPLAAVTEAKDAKDSKATVKATTRPWHPLQLIVFTNLQLLDAEFTESTQIIPGTTQTFVGNEPAYAPDVVVKGGITFKRDQCFNITFSAVHVSEQFWQDSNLGSASIPLTTIPSYEVFNFSGEFYITHNVRVFGGISNLSDEKYYSRVFPFGGGSIDPAPGRSGHLGLSVEF